MTTLKTTTTTDTTTTFSAEESFGRIRHELGSDARTVRDVLEALERLETGEDPDTVGADLARTLGRDCGRQWANNASREIPEGTPFGDWDAIASQSLPSSDDISWARTIWYWLAQEVDDIPAWSEVAGEFGAAMREELFESSPTGEPAEE